MAVTVPGEGALRPLLASSPALPFLWSSPCLAAGLFTEIASSYWDLLASVGLIAFLLLALGRVEAGIFPSPASVMVGVAVLAFVYYCGLTTALAAAMLVPTALAIFPKNRGFGWRSHRSFRRLGGPSRR